MCRTLGCVAVILCFCLAGCGGGPDLNLVPVEGTVTLDGSPLANKTLMFTPDASDGVSAGGNTDASGKYTLTATVAGVTSDQQGVPPGKYKVTVFEPAIPIEGGKAGDEMIEDMIIPGETRGSQIPRKYQAVDTTDLAVEVPEEGGTIDLQLTSS